MQFPFLNVSLKTLFILPQKPFVLYFSNRNIWGLIKTIKNAIKRSLVKTPAAFITEHCFPQSPKELSACGNECVMCLMELWCWIFAKVWKFSSTCLRNSYSGQSEKYQAQVNQVALQFPKTLSSRFRPHQNLTFNLKSGARGTGDNLYSPLPFCHIRIFQISAVCSTFVIYHWKELE